MTASNFHRWLFGNYLWPDSDEYRAFQFKFLVAVILVGAACTMALVIPAWMEVNPIPENHVQSMVMFSGFSVLMWWLLRR